jgi:hypothetical protein
MIAAVVMALATAVPAVAAAVPKATIVQTWAIPAIDVEANRDILEWIQVIDWKAPAQGSR